MQFQRGRHHHAGGATAHPPYPNRRKIVKESFQAGRVLAENRLVWSV